MRQRWLAILRLTNNPDHGRAATTRPSLELDGVARSRNLKPGFFKNEVLAQCSHLARILFAALWCEADRDGRLEDRPIRIKAEWLPYDKCDCESLLSELASHGFIVRYEVDGRKFIAIPTFELHQNPHRDEKSRDFPAPPDSKVQCQHGASTVQAQCDSGSGTVARRPITDSLSLDSLDLIPSISTEAKNSPSVPLASFPCAGKKQEPKEWHLRSEHVAEWSEAYPGVEVLAECKKALAWVKANSGRRKTARGMPRFLTGWLSRVQDRGGNVRTVVAGEVRPALDPSIWSGNE